MRASSGTLVIVDLLLFLSEFTGLPNLSPVLPGTFGSVVEVVTNHETLKESPATERPG